jgi:hypothetical protein
VEADGFGVSDWLKSVGGALFFVAGLLTWWELEDANGLSFPTNGFDYRLTGIVPYVIFVGIAILTIVIRTGSLRLPEVLLHPLLSLVAAAIGTALVIARFLFDGWEDSLLQGRSANRGIGLYLALAAALTVLAGCVIAYRDSRAADVDEEVDEAVDDTPNDADRPPRRSSPPLP